MQARPLAGRSKKEGFLAMGGTWLAFTLALCLALPQPPEPRLVVLGMFAGAVMVVLGFLAAVGNRSPLRKTSGQKVNLALLSLLVGIAMGATLLGMLLALARLTPSLHARFAGRLTEPFWRPWALAFESSILEEVTFRLFLMSIVAWIAARIKRPGGAFVIALFVSALLFGLAHLPAWFSLAHPSLALISSVLLLNGFGGLIFGWIFWRWGLAYAILCHLAGDVVVQTLGPKLLG